MGAVRRLSDLAPERQKARLVKHLQEEVAFYANLSNGPVDQWPLVSIALSLDDIARSLRQIAKNTSHM